MNPTLQVKDVVEMDDCFGNHWTGGVITAVRPEGFYVRWPDAVIGIFAHRHAQHLKRTTP